MISTLPAMPEEPIIADAPHGTITGYEQGCRCMWCRSADQAATDPPGSPGQ